MMRWRVRLPTPARGQKVFFDVASISPAAGDVAGPDFCEVGFGVAFDGFAVEPHGFGSNAVWPVAARQVASALSAPSC